MLQSPIAACGNLVEKRFPVALQRARRFARRIIHEELFDGGKVEDRFSEFGVGFKVVGRREGEEGVGLRCEVVDVEVLRTRGLSKKDMLVGKKHRLGGLRW